MIQRRYRTLTTGVIMALMLACAPVFAPAPQPIPTFDPNSPLTAIVETAAAANTQTALAAPPTIAPTDTPTPTLTPTETATPTFVFFLESPTPKATFITPGSTGKEYQCQVTSQSPRLGGVIQAGAEFDAVWDVTNVGTNAWLSTNVDYRYHSGDRLHLQPAYDFDFSIATGNNTVLKVRMKAPSEPGTYKTEWRIAMGNTTFCPLQVRIVVQ